jgi:hypothetical protein
MPQNWIPMLIVGALALIIPLTILIGQWLRIGPMIVANGGALLGLAIFWLNLREFYQPLGPNRLAPLVSIVAAIGGALLLLAGWTLALADAALARRWGWMALLCLATFISVGAIYNLVGTPYMTCVALPSEAYACALVNPIAEALTIAGDFVGPATALVYALRQHALHSRALLDGLSVSPLDAPQAEPL